MEDATELLKILNTKTIFEILFALRWQFYKSK